jgi:soluble epoxide hydrolase/lipid-phosphate phosphatase
MDQLEKRTVKTKRSLEYTYYISRTSEANVSRPALLFLHGFPDSHLLWYKVVAGLSDLETRILVPDLLGYGGTSKPRDVTLYSYSGMASDLNDILRAEKILKVIVIGHDWGSWMAQRFYLHLPEMVAGVVLLNVEYQPPEQDRFDLAAVNTSSEAQFGYPRYGCKYQSRPCKLAPLLADDINRSYQCNSREA